MRVFGQWYPGTSSTPSDSSTPEGAIDRALARIHEAWEEAAEQVRTALPAGHDLSSHELGIHLTPDGPRMVLILFDQTHETAVVH